MQEKSKFADQITKPMKKTIVVLSALALTGLFPSCQKERAINPAAPIAVQSFTNGQIIPNQYIVVLKDEIVSSDMKLASIPAYADRVLAVNSFSRQLLAENNIVAGNNISQTYAEALKGFAATLSPTQADNLKNDNRIAFIEPDRMFVLGGKPGGGGGGAAQVTPWGIARVGSADGTGKTAWIIDTGVDLTHPDLNVDLARAKTFITAGLDAQSPNDLNGHGTHVSGTIAAKNNTTGVIGVAYGAKVVPVKVLDRNGSGSYSGVIAGVDYVAATAAAGDAANMSLGGPISVALDNAIMNAASKGIIFALAAGNDGADANNNSPGHINGANIFTISAMDNTDKFASFSNYGNPPVDFCAPGVSVYSCWKGGAYNTISGTSMATPHVTGLLLLNGVNIVTSGYVTSDPDGNADPIAHH